MEKKKAQPTQEAKINATLRQEALDKKREGNRFLLLAIYAMAFFFFLDILYIQDVWLGFIALVAQLFGGVFENAVNWVAWWKGTMTVIKVGGFVVSLVFARFLARQRA